MRASLIVIELSSISLDLKLINRVIEKMSPKNQNAEKMCKKRFFSYKSLGLFLNKSLEYPLSSRQLTCLDLVKLTKNLKNFYIFPTAKNKST